MKLRITLLVLAAGIIFGCYAQVPGFAGKKFGVHANLGMTPALHAAFMDSYGKPKDYGYDSNLWPVGLNFMPSFGVEYALTKSLAIGVDDVYFTKHQPTHYFYLEDENLVSQGYLGETKLRAHMFGYYLKIYPYRKRGSIAPLGRYNKFEAMFGDTHVNTGNLVITDYPDATDFYPIAGDVFASVPHSTVEELGLPSIPVIYASYSIGTNQVIFDKFITNFEMQLSFPISLYDGYEDESLYGYGYGDYSSWMQDTVWPSLVFMIHLGIGYELF